jgi:hypothetical protein
MHHAAQARGAGYVAAVPGHFPDGGCEAAEADAEGMEHYASEATLAAFSRFLRRPRREI